MQSRFALIAAPLAIIWLGFIFKMLKIEKNAFRFSLFSMIIFSLVIFNGFRIKKAFHQLAVAGSENASAQVEDIFPKTDRITLEQQYAIVDYLKSKFSQNNFPIYIKSNKSEYENTFWYHLGNLGVVNYGPLDKENLCSKANYFLIKTIDHPRDLVLYFDILETKHFGTLTVFHLIPKKEKTVCDEPANLVRHFTNPEAKAAEMLTWKKLFR